MEAHPAPRPRLYFDLGSPYSWLAFERADRIFDTEVELEPILIGGIFRLRGWGSWSQTETRQENVDEIEMRAEQYGLGPINWPVNWPDNTLMAMRCTVWADEQGRLESFSRVAFRKAFKDGGDLSDREVLSVVASECGLDSRAMLAAASSGRIKEDLRTRTDRAWSLGVKGAPAVLVGEKVFYGDDQLEEAAETMRNEDSRR